MKRIIVFRFHAHPAICENRLRCLKKFNPDVKIYGLFGGPEKEYGKFKRRLMPFLEHCYCIRDKTDRWKWKNGDLALRLWYTAVGNTVSFDMVHVIEWDLLLWASVHEIYKDIPLDAIGLTALVPLQEVAGRWIWSAEEPHKGELANLLVWVRENFGYSQPPYGAQAPGICLPRRFLEAYSRIEIPELCNDEVRLPLFGQIFGLTLHDTRFCTDWFTRSAGQTFHCQTRVFPEVDLPTIKRELAKPAGARVFHPFRRMVIFEPMDYVRNFFIALKERARSSAKSVLYTLLPRCLNQGSQAPRGRR
jgi:hypothetical protein